MLFAGPLSCPWSDALKPGNVPEEKARNAAREVPKYGFAGHSGRVETPSLDVRGKPRYDHDNSLYSVFILRG